MSRFRLIAILSKYFERILVGHFRAYASFNSSISAYYWSAFSLNDSTTAFRLCTFKPNLNRWLDRTLGSTLSSTSEASEIWGSAFSESKNSSFFLR
jgi:hypothetical protein